jgi:hypothetical protein
MKLSIRQRWRLFRASLTRQQHFRELNMWLALKTTSELIQIRANHQAPAVQAELRRRGMG